MSDPELRERIRGRLDLADLEPYRAPQLDAPVKLNTNESPFPPPESVIRELHERISAQSLNRYPQRDFPELREALARHAGTLTDRVWAANGSNEVLLQLLLAFGGPDRKVMMFSPTYAMHGHITRISGTRSVAARRNPDYSMDLEASVQTVHSQRPDVVFLCSPNNPTGNSESQDLISSICDAAPGIVILDEAYGEFAAESNAPLIEAHENLAVTRSFSKAWRLAGSRLGYLLAAPWIINEVLKVRLPYHLSSLTQAAGMAALNHEAELIGTVETIKYERERVWRELSTTGGILPFPSDANFILFRCIVHPAKEVWEQLLEAGVLVRDFSDTRGCEGCLRVSIGTKEQNEKFLEALSKVLARK